MESILSIRPLDATCLLLRPLTAACHPVDLDTCTIVLWTAPVKQRILTRDDTGWPRQGRCPAAKTIMTLLCQRNRSQSPWSSAPPAPPQPSTCAPRERARCLPPRIPPSLDSVDTSHDYFAAVFQVILSLSHSATYTSASSAGTCEVKEDKPAVGRRLGAWQRPAQAGQG
jgi:hypothetical protein